MSRTIRLEERVYNDLEGIREKRETFSQAVERIIRVYVTMKEVSDTLGPSHYLKGDRPIDARAQTTIDGRGISSPVRDL